MAFYCKPGIFCQYSKNFFSTAVDIPIFNASALIGRLNGGLFVLKLNTGNFMISCVYFLLFGHLYKKHLKKNNK